MEFELSFQGGERWHHVCYCSEGADGLRRLDPFTPATSSPLTLIELGEDEVERTGLLELLVDYSGDGEVISVAPKWEVGRGDMVGEWFVKVYADNN